MNRSPAIPPMMSLNEVTALTMLFQVCTNPKIRARALQLVPDLADLKVVGSLGYWIGSDDVGPTITCLECGLTSHNRNDVENRYCGNCHKFHEEL